MFTIETRNHKQEIIHSVETDDIAEAFALREILKGTMYGSDWLSMYQDGKRISNERVETHNDMYDGRSVRDLLEFGFSVEEARRYVFQKESLPKPIPNFVDSPNKIKRGRPR